MKGHIAKKGNRYYAVVYVDGKPKWHSIPGAKVTKKEAERYLNELVNKIEKNLYVDSRKMTVEDLLAKWIEGRTDLAPKTFKRHKEIIDLHLIPALGHIKLDKLQPLHLQDYYDTALKSGRIGRKYADNPGLSASTVLQHHRVLHAALNQAMEWGLLARNVSDAVRKPKKTDPVNFEPSLEMIFEVLEALRGDIIYIPTVLALNTGVRRGEVLGFRWKDYNEKTGVIRVIQTLQRVKGEGLKFLPPKTKGSKRIIELPNNVILLLEQHKARQDIIRMSLGDTYQDQDLICCWDDGRPIDPDIVTKHFEKVTEKLGYPDFRFHDLRHAHATFLLAEGVDFKTMQARLGHATAAFMLDRYSHAIPSKQKQAATKAGELFCKEKKTSSVGGKGS